MKNILILAFIITSTSAIAEPWDKLVNKLTAQRTLKELIDSKSKFYSRFERTRLTRELDFGYSHTTWEFDYVHGNSSTDFKLTLLSIADSIVFGHLERLNWKKKTEESYMFSTSDSAVQNLVLQHNSFYLTNYTTEEFLTTLNKKYYYSLGCGETGSQKPNEADKMLNWSKSNNTKKLGTWLCSPNFELQAYAIDGLTRMKKRGKMIPKHYKKIIKHLRERNSIVVNCAGCLMGLETPVNDLLF